jgi:hypothetical protein
LLSFLCLWCFLLSAVQGRLVWGFVDREGYFGCREEMVEIGEWPRGELVLVVLSFSFKN